jgi:aryl-alcohol dehydrogenase-like predicted oxidoreductase
MHRPQGSVIPIIGARSMAQFENNLECLNLALNQTQIEELDALNPPPPVYPASLFKTDFYRAMMHGEKRIVD